MVKEGCGLPNNHNVNTDNIMLAIASIDEIQKLGSNSDGSNSDGAANPFTLLSSSLIAIVAALTLNWVNWQLHRKILNHDELANVRSSSLKVSFQLLIKAYS